MEKGLVSIIMPTYNCGRFITETIESIQAQTYENWEIEIVDDCSKDDTIGEFITATCTGYVPGLILFALTNTFSSLCR